jgi:hypothetical protein
MLREHAAMPMPTDSTATAIRDQCATIVKTPRQLVNGILDVRSKSKLLDYKQLNSFDYEQLTAAAKLRHERADR